MELMRISTARADDTFIYYSCYSYYYTAKYNSFINSFLHSSCLSIIDACFIMLCAFGEFHYIVNFSVVCQSSASNTRREGKTSLQLPTQIHLLRMRRRILGQLLSLRSLHCTQVGKCYNLATRLNVRTRECRSTGRQTQFKLFLKNSNNCNANKLRFCNYSHRHSPNKYKK